jgi:hypothetical protein
MFSRELLCAALVMSLALTLAGCEEEDQSAEETAMNDRSNAQSSMLGGGQVRREGSTVWIEGVPAERRVEGMWHMDGLPASLRAALAFKGVEAKYLDDTLFGAITGEPFRFWFADDFASCLAYTYEEPVGVIVAEALGYDYTWCDHGAITRSGAASERVTNAADAWQKVREELDAGHPVVLFGGSTPPEETALPVLVTGYDSEREAVYFVPHTGWRPAPEWSDEDPQCRDGMKDQGYRSRPQPNQTNWHGNGFAPNHGQGGAAVCFFAFGDRRRAVTERDVATAVLRRAVALGRGRLIDEQRDYRQSGLWIATRYTTSGAPDRGPNSETGGLPWTP